MHIHKSANLNVFCRRYFQLNVNFTRELFHVNFCEVQFLFQTYFPKMFPTRDIGEKLNFGIFETPWGTKLHQDHCGLLVC